MRITFLKCESYYDSARYLLTDKSALADECLDKVDDRDFVSTFIIGHLRNVTINRWGTFGSHAFQLTHQLFGKNLFQI